MKAKNSPVKRVIIILLVLVLAAGIAVAGWYFYSQWKYDKAIDELADIYDATLTYSDAAIDRIYDNTQNIEDAEADYHSLWFLHAKEEGRDDLFLAVFRKEDGALNIYSCQSNPSATGEISWEKKTAGAAKGPLLTFLPKQVENRKDYVSYAVRCDGITDFTGEEDE